MRALLCLFDRRTAHFVAKKLHLLNNILTSNGGTLSGEIQCSQAPLKNTDTTKYQLFIFYNNILFKGH